MKITLYGNGVFGTKEWSIWSEGNQIIIQANGAYYSEEIKEGKGGRTISEQIALRIEARVRSKLDSGFKRTIEELGSVNTNQLGLDMPMLAVKFNKNLVHKISLGRERAFIQPKYNGHRCLIGQDGAYSRKGREIDTIPEIIKSLYIPDGMTFDGELYCHGVPLQTISSWAKRRQSNTKKLHFVIYDIVVPDLPFEERNKLLNSLVKESDYIRLASTDTYNPAVSYAQVWSNYRNQGYEGGILRTAGGLYLPGVRSKELIKIKKRDSQEFKCVDIVSSRDGYGILILEVSPGQVFKCVAPGPVPFKKQVLDQKEKYIGRLVECEYAELTNEGIPFHCVAIDWKREL